MTTATQTLADFVLARVSDEQAEAAAAIKALRAANESAEWWVDGPGAASGKWWVYATGEKFTHKEVADHIARHDPARALRQCAAYRKVVESYLAMQDGKGAHGLVARITDPVSLATFEHVLRALSSTWSDHPDYRAGEWAL